MKVGGSMGVLLVSLTLVTAPGCATIVKGSRQNVRVESNPAGAQVRGNFKTITTPGVLRLDRGAVHVLEISKEGYETRNVRLDRTDNGWMWLNAALLPLAILAVIIDACTDAGFDLVPARVVVELDPLPAVPASR